MEGAPTVHPGVGSHLSSNCRVKPIVDWFHPFVWDIRTGLRILGLKFIGVVVREATSVIGWIASGVVGGEVPERVNGWFVCEARPMRSEEASAWTVESLWVKGLGWVSDFVDKL